MSVTVEHRAAELEEQRHPLIRRLSHWLMAFAVLALIGSGWGIYNAAPIFGFRFPDWAALGYDVDVSLAWHNDPGVATAIAWHFAAIWLLAAGFVIFVLHGLLSGHFRHSYFPVTPRSFLRDFFAAATFRLIHRLGEYNAVQKAFYLGVLLALAVMIVSGLAIWKPVQLAWLTEAFGGFQSARLVHFLFMTAISVFVLVHIALVALVPKTFVAMVLGRASVRHGGR